MKTFYPEPDPAKMPSHDYPLANILLRPTLWECILNSLLRVRWDCLRIAVILTIVYVFVELVCGLFGGAR